MRYNHFPLFTQLDSMDCGPTCLRMIARYYGLTTTYGKELPYLPDMTAVADIVTEDISLLERFFLPIKKVWTEGMGR
jgi:hypothetical protein